MILDFEPDSPDLPFKGLRFFGGLRVLQALEEPPKPFVLLIGRSRPDQGQGKTGRKKDG
jgi:hypothetical protein